jgi:hypothetical protein
VTKNKNLLEEKNTVFVIGFDMFFGVFDLDGHNPKEFCIFRLGFL